MLAALCLSELAILQGWLAMAKAASKKHWMKAALVGMLVGSFTVLATLCLPKPALAQGRLAVARAAADFLIEKFGGQFAREGAGALAGRLEGMALRHGDEVFKAARSVGPQFFKVMEEVGVNNAGKAVRVMAQHGEGGVAWILRRPKAMSLLTKYGEEAGAVLVKHPGGFVEPLLEQGGANAIKAFQAVGPQGGRRLAMLLGEGGELAATGHTPELLQVCGMWGQKGCDFLWKNKAPLATATVLAAFLAAPEAFITGARDITKIVGDDVLKPIAELPRDVATEFTKSVNWTFVLMAGLLPAALLLAGTLTFLPWLRQFAAAWLVKMGGGQPAAGAGRAVAKKLQSFMSRLGVGDKPLSVTRGKGTVWQRLLARIKASISNDLPEVIPVHPAANVASTTRSAGHPPALPSPTPSLPCQEAPLSNGSDHGPPC